MKKSTISEKGNPFTTIGLFIVIIEDLARLEKRISSLENILAMNYVIDQNLVLQYLLASYAALKYKLLSV